MKTTFINHAIGTIAILTAMLFTSQVFAASDYLLHIEGTKGEGKGKTFKLSEQSDGSFTVTNIPAGVYKLICVPAQGVDPSIPHQGVAKTTVPYAGSLADQGELVNASGKRTFNLECIVSPRDAASGQASG